MPVPHCDLFDHHVTFYNYPVQKGLHTNIAVFAGGVQSPPNPSTNGWRARPWVVTGQQPIPRPILGWGIHCLQL